MQGTAMESPLLLAAAGYKDGKHGMSCCVKGKGWQEESDPKSNFCGLFLVILYLQCVLKAFIQISLAS